MNDATRVLRRDWRSRRLLSGREVCESELSRAYWMDEVDVEKAVGRR